MLLLSQVAPPIVGWSLVADAGAPGLGEGTVTTPPIDTTGANLLILVGQAYLSGGQSVQDFRPADSKNNQWTLGIATPSGGSGVAIHYCVGGIVGAGHTFSWTAPYGPMQVLAFSGPSAMADQTSAAAEVDPIRPGPITPSVDGALLVTGACNYGVFASVSDGFEITDNILFVGGVTMGGAAAYLIQDIAAAINPTWTMGSVDYPSPSAAIISFKGAA